MVSQLSEHRGRAALCMLKRNFHDHTVFWVRLNELRRLVESLGTEVIEEFIQTRIKPFSKYYVGKGKIKEITRCVIEKKIDVVVFYNFLSSNQKLNLIRALNCDVIDRYELTLEIFERMASDSLSKIQIEAARLNKLVPYFKLEAKKKFHNDHPFFRSRGEYAFHNQIRELTKRQARLRSQIEALVTSKDLRIQKQRELNYPTVCIAGFYNAGKTTLFNVLTGESKPVDSKPFTTLSSKYQQRYVDSDLSLIFIDTIGFVLDLDPNLIHSFRLNLEDIRYADVVLLLLDITDNPLTLKMKLSEGLKLLVDIGVSKRQILVVFNKIDLDPRDVKEKIQLVSFYDVDWTTTSAQQRTNINQLLNRIQEKLKTFEAARVYKSS